MEIDDFKSQEAFEFSYKKYYPALCKFAYRYLDSENDARDVVQDLFVYIWTHRGKITINTSVKSYLYAAVRNRSLSKLKSRLGIIDLSLEAHQLSVQPSDPDYPALELAIRQAITALPERCRTIFELSRDHGLKYAQVAEKLGISEKTVENQIGIALERLRGVTREFFSIVLF